jgi:hypothetical protein
VRSLHLPADKHEAARTLHGEGNSYGTTDAGIFACYNCPLVGELADSLVKLIATIFGRDVFTFGLDVELGFQAWEFLMLNCRLAALKSYS